MAKNKQYTIPITCFEAFNKALAEESDRARVLLVASWIDEFLKVKLQNEFSKGNRDARKQLFSSNGPFSNMSGRLNTVFCAGWIDADVYHDVNIIRKIRNDCAHEVEPISLNDNKYRDNIEKLLVPLRQYSDWGELRAVSIENGAILYTGERPQNTKEDLYIPGALTFRMAASVIIAVLILNLNIPFSTEDDNIAFVTIPEHLRGGKMDIKEVSLSDKAEIDKIEKELKQRGFKSINQSTKLQPNQYVRNEWAGDIKSFEGHPIYHIKWCEP